MSYLVLFCAYREWGIKSYHDLVEVLNQSEQKFNLQLVTSQENLISLLSHGVKPDLVLCAGWSWIIPAEALSICKFYGIHPSDLPLYAGGSPIQHQIIDGIETSKVTLFEMKEKLDQGPIIQKLPLSLAGPLSEILSNLSLNTTLLFSRLLAEFPNINYSAKDTISPTSVIRKRLNASSGEITKKLISELTAKQLFDFIRCRENPYPNAFIQDETGTLFFSHVVFDQHGKK